MPTMPKPYPREFREDVVAVARKGEDTVAQIAKDFGIAESCLRNWLHAADVEDGKRPGQSAQESEQLRELKRRNRLLEQENEVLRRAAAYLSQGINPK
jgi:transposase